jgi:hypothetical protein
MFLLFYSDKYNNSSACSLNIINCLHSRVNLVNLDPLVPLDLSVLRVYQGMMEGKEYLENQDHLVKEGLQDLWDLLDLLEPLVLQDLRYV